MITSKQPKLGLTQELFFSRICQSTTGYTFTLCVGSFISPGIDTRQKGPKTFSRGITSEATFTLYNLGTFIYRLTWITTYFEKLNINLNDYSQRRLSVLCLFYISHNRVGLNLKNKITQTSKKYNIIYYSLHCRSFYE